MPALFRAVKRIVDDDASPGQFLLTGSAGVTVLPRLSEALVGRMQILTLWPFSQDELARRPADFVDRAFSDEPLAARARGGLRAGFWDRVRRGGFPEACRRRDARSRAAFFDSYVTTVLQRDVRDFASVQGIAEFPRILAALAVRNATILNLSEIARDLAVPQTTLKRYLALLEGAFLAIRVPAWSANLGQRLVKSPKLLVGDTGLSAAQLGLEGGAGPPPDPQAGRLLEAFVGLELMKQLGWSATRARLHHFRDHSGNEVDWILEDVRGRVVGVEVKTAASVGARDWRGLRHLSSALGERFHRGFVLHSGTRVVPLSERVFAAPLDLLWRGPGRT